MLRPIAYMNASLPIEALVYAAFRSLLAINASTSSFENCHPSFVLLYLSFQSTSYTSNITRSSHYLGWPLLYRLPRFSKEEDCIAYIRLGHVYSFFRQISPPTPTLLLTQLSTCYDQSPVRRLSLPFAQMTFALKVAHSL